MFKYLSSILDNARVVYKFRAFQKGNQSMRTFGDRRLCHRKERIHKKTNAKRQSEKELKQWQVKKQMFKYKCGTMTKLLNKCLHDPTSESLLQLEWEVQRACCTKQITQHMIDFAQGETYKRDKMSPIEHFKCIIEFLKMANESKDQDSDVH
jgi:hypothetical protein